jgi:tripartite ATP-independent transporter DctP family solute receptor
MKSAYKKCISLFLVLCTGAVLAFGGGQQSGAASGTDAKPKYVFKVATAGQPGDSLDSSLKLFLKTVNERTNGAITGEVYAASQLGNHRDYIDGLQIGSIQVAEISAAVLSTVAPKFSIFDLPYISKSPQALYNILDKEAGDILTKHIEDVAQIRTIGWMVRTPRHVYSAKGPIRTVADFSGLKIRTMESAPMLKTMTLFNAKATPIPTAERYMALQTGVVQAAENNVAEIYNCKEFEVTKYLSKTAHLVTPNIICIGTKFLASLPEEYQKIIIEAGREAGAYGTQFEINGEKGFEEKLVSEGKMIVNEIPDKSSFTAVLAPLYAEYTPTIGQDLITLFQNQ